MKMHVFKTRIDPRKATSDFARDERFAATRALMVKQNAIAGIHPVSLAIVHSYPVGVKLGDAIGAARIKGCGFFLRNFLHQAIELTCTGLINTRFVCKPQHPHCFKDAQGAKRIGIGGVFRRLEAHSHMALSSKVVDLVGLNLLDDSDQISAVGEIAVMQDQAWIHLMRILIQMIDPGGVEATRPALDAVHHIALLQQELS